MRECRRDRHRERVSGRLALGFLAGVAALVSTGAATPSPFAKTIRVPDDAATLQLAIDRSSPGDTVVLGPGTYPGGVLVPPAKHDVTIRGVDRNTVVLDGENRRKNGVVVHADGVSILNLSAHDFTKNALYWDGADRFRASYVTVWNVGEYGIYVEDGEHGRVDHTYVSGAARAAYYVGECRPCDATVSNVVARLSAIGYSGTNATGVVIRDSLWDRNGAGLVPNTYANEALPPQARATIVRNTVTGSGRAGVPIKTALAGFIGVGIAVAGGNENTIASNRVTRSERYGVAIFPTARFVVFDPGTPEPGPPWRPRGNRVSRNVVAGSGRADLALASGVRRGNCFTANRAGRTAPGDLQTPTCADASSPGDPAVAAELTRPVREMMLETLARRNPPSYASMPKPPAQPSMP
jgi:parallel beta helix pectate lyase-like protein